MAYPGQFLRLVLIGSLYGDTFNTTLSFVPTNGSTVAQPTPAVMTALKGVIANFWSTASSTTFGFGITQNAILNSFKLNRIGPDGRYVDNETVEEVWSPIITGVGPLGFPAQNALALTIRGANERARAGRGRMYLPMGTLSSTLDGTGRISIANATLAADKFHDFLTNMDGVMIDASMGALAGIASKSGAGGFQVMSRVSCGRVVDTIRSRRSKLDEDPQFFPA